MFHVKPSDEKLPVPTVNISLSIVIDIDAGDLNVIAQALRRFRSTHTDNECADRIDNMAAKFESIAAAAPMIPATLIRLSPLAENASY